MTIRILFIALTLCLSTSVFAQDQTVDRTVPESREQLQLSFAPVVKKITPAVVNIYTKRTVARAYRHPFLDDPFFAPFFGNNRMGSRMRQQVENSLGSGVIVQADGLVVTNAHVVKEADEITVVLADGREFDARTVLSDEASDLALLRIDPNGESLPYASLKPSESLEVGDIVLAIGNPFGVGQTVTSGIVSAQGRSALDINDFNFFIQTDAAINPGNSGGPLVTLDGGVVGINSAIYSRSGGSLGIGFAVPSEMVVSVIAAEKSDQTGTKGIVRPWLGVTVQNVTADIASSLGMDRPAGVLIAKLHSASPLREAGIQTGDVVLSVNGKDIRDASEMRFRMATIPLGQTTRMEVVRKNKKDRYEVKAIAPPDKPARNPLLIKGNTPLSGATLVNLNPAVAIELGLPDEETGVVVSAIAQKAPAMRFLSPGDLILEINGDKIKAPDDVTKALKKANKGLSLIVRNNGRTRRITIR